MLQQLLKQDKKRLIQLREKVKTAALIAEREWLLQQYDFAVSTARI